MTIQFRSVRGLTKEPITPAWVPMTTLSQKEKYVKAMLEMAGATVMYPTVTKVRHHAGKKYETERPFISGLIYVQWHFRPLWHVLRERYNVKPMLIGGVPYVMNPDSVSRVMGLPTEAERIEAARIEATMPKVGERALLAEGLLAGQYVDVTAIHDGKVWFDTVNLGFKMAMKGSAPIENVVRVAE